MSTPLSNAYITIGVTIHESRDYQQKALDECIKFNIEKKEFILSKDIIFTIQKDLTLAGLTGKYNDVYLFIREDKTVSLISYNLDVLKGIIAFIKRISE